MGAAGAAGLARLLGDSGPVRSERSPASGSGGTTPRGGRGGWLRVPDGAVADGVIAVLATGSALPGCGRVGRLITGATGALGRAWSAGSHRCASACFWSGTARTTDRSAISSSSRGSRSDPLSSARIDDRGRRARGPRGRGRARASRSTCCSPGRHPRPARARPRSSWPAALRVEAIERRATGSRRRLAASCPGSSAASRPTPRPTRPRRGTRAPRPRSGRSGPSRSPRCRAAAWRSRSWTCSSETGPERQPRRGRGHAGGRARRTGTGSSRRMAPRSGEWCRRV